MQNVTNLLFTSPKNGNFVPHIVPNLFLSYVEHKRRYFKE